MSNKTIDINSIPGIQDLDDTTAQNCGGGSFDFIGVNQNGQTITHSTLGNSMRLRINESDGITAFNLQNTGGSNRFRIEYRNANNRVVGLEEITGGQRPSQYRGLGRLANGAVTETVEIYQPPAPDPDPQPGVPRRRNPCAWAWECFAPSIP